MRCVIIICGIIYLDSINIFSYYDYSKIYSKDFKDLDLQLEYLTLVNTFNNLGLKYKGLSLNSISYDDFLSYMSETMIVTLDEYLDIYNNFIEPVNKYNEELNDNNVDNSDIILESMNIYNISVDEPSKQLELDKWLGLTSDKNQYDTSVDGVYADLTSNQLFNFVMCCYNYAKKGIA